MRFPYFALHYSTGVPLFTIILLVGQALELIHKRQQDGEEHTDKFP